MSCYFKMQGVIILFGKYVEIIFIAKFSVSLIFHFSFLISIVNIMNIIIMIIKENNANSNSLQHDLKHFRVNSITTYVSALLNQESVDK